MIATLAAAPESAAAPAAPPARASLPWLPVTSLGADAYARVRRRAIFDCCKWDPQVEDTPAIAPFPLLLRASAWRELAVLAERLAAETLAAEAELLERPELHGLLALPRRVRAALHAVERAGPSRGVARLIRFDFHWTREGWRISEANSDVPGGLNEASGFARLFAPAYADAHGVGDTVAGYADAMLRAVGRTDASIGLVHATAYTDDRQVMVYVARALESRGARAALLSPAQLRWRDGRAHHADVALDGLIRFFPAEWLVDLPRDAAWTHFFAGARTPLSNPAGALLTQSKRFPLVWDDLRTALPTWRALLPETRDPRACRWSRSDEWVLKPALGRVGEDVALRGVIADKEWRAIARSARWFPQRWAAQRRFEAVPLEVAGARCYPCIGVFTIDGRVAGAYGRLAPRPLIDWHAQDVAVMRTEAEEERWPS